MPNIKSAKKRVLVTKKRTLENKMLVSEIKTSVKKFNAAVAAADTAKATELFNATLSLVDCACKKGIYHRNNAARKQSSMQTALNSISK
ncbi:MAG: 30S ribosomal protein S20 [Bacillota bacterium]